LKTNLKKIAIFLPQFHPIPENDEWWGKGFTEWTNVTKGKPRFQGHYQPHLPADLGFYDLRLEESRLAQEALAKEFDIYGFCYYHYWFNGKRLLHEPLDRKLNNPKEDLPFMMCWANENWTRAWDGSENNILLKQNYTEEDDREHIKFLIPLFKDERYIKVNGKPFFIFYKPSLFPNMKRTVEIFREEAQKAGLELYLCWFERNIGWEMDDAKDTGFDAAAEFQPLSKSYTDFFMYKSGMNKKNTLKNLKRKIISVRNKLLELINKNVTTRIIDYEEFVNFDLNSKNSQAKIFPGVSPMWDNSSRRVNQKATVFKNSTPELFKKWYQGKCNQFEPFSEEENFIFINAWNEWAEGNHLEPCQKWGKGYLEALK
jgi:lipopolysaccharide biosynthesis protein